MQYGIFKRSIMTHSGGATVISFTSLQSPGDQKEPIRLEAANEPEAANKAAELLKMLRMKTHSTCGNPDTIMTEVPNYFVGRLDSDKADRYDTNNMAFLIEVFTPVPE